MLLNLPHLPLCRLACGSVLGNDARTPTLDTSRSIPRDILMRSLLCTLLMLAGMFPLGAAEKPNVLFIAIDDLNDWIGCLQGHPQVKTPHMDRLAARGTLFTNAHCQAPICNPSRTSLMLGLRPSTTGIYGLAPWFRHVDGLKDKVSMGQYFSHNGYHSMSVGKIYHGGSKGREDEFDEWGPNMKVGARPPAKLVETPEKHPLVDWGTFPHEDEDRGDWATASWAVETLGKQADAEKPFFLAVGFFLPHVPCYAPPKWFDLYPDDELQLPPHLEGDRLDLPRFASYLHWSLPETRLSWLKQANEWRSLVRAYLASISYVDDQVGRVLDALEKSGKEDETVVVLWSDHGWHLGEKDITGKNTLWARSTRVPLMFAGPGIGKGKVCHRPAELLDLYPTLIDLCGLPKKADLEGHSLQPQLQDPQAPRTFPAITTHNHDNHSAVTEDWRYIRYADGSEEFYDLKNDPNEWTNLAGDDAHRKTMDQLAAHLPKTSQWPAPGSKSRVLTYKDGVAVWEGKEIDPTTQTLPGDVPVTLPGANIFPKDAEPVEILSEGAGEGPAWHPRHGLVFSGGGNIQHLDRNNVLGVFRKGTGSNGLLFDPDGHLLVCGSKTREVFRIRPDGDMDLFSKSYEGKRYNTPNDLAIDSKGRLYFTDPRYGSRESIEMFDDQGKAIEGVYRIDPDGKVTRVITHEVERPNGILVSRNDRHLYVADNNNKDIGGARKLWRFDLNDGEVDLATRTLIYDWGSTRGPDGMAQDIMGRLYVAAGIHKAKPPVETGATSTAGVYVLSPEGALLDFVSIPNDEVTNCTFGGPDWRTLYITAGGHLWAIETVAPGHMPLSVRASSKKPVLLYSLHFNAEGENRYPADGAYSKILKKLSRDFEIRVHNRPLNKTTLLNVDAVLISNPSAKAVKGYPPPPRFRHQAITNLVDYVNNGGGLLIMGNQENHNLETVTTNQLLGHFGLKWVDRFTDAKALTLHENTPVVGGLTWAYYTGNLIETAANHPAKPRPMVLNDLSQPPLTGSRDQAGCLLAMAEPGHGRVLSVTDSGWIINNVLEGKGIAGMVIKNHDNAEIFHRLVSWITKR